MLLVKILKSSKIQHLFAILLLIKLVGLRNESLTLQIEH